MFKVPSVLTAVTLLWCLSVVGATADSWKRVKTWDGYDLADTWIRIRTAQAGPVFGAPMRIEDVVLAGESDNRGVVHNIYKFIIRRPGIDDGRGVGIHAAGNFRLYYWAALTEKMNYLNIAAYDEKNVYQDIDFDPNKVLVNLQDGLTPGTYNIVVGIYPYPYIYGYSFKTAIQLYRSNYVAFLMALLKNTSIMGALGSYAYSYGESQLLDYFLTKLSEDYGETIRLEVLAKVPNLFGMNEFEASNLLRARSLVPAPDSSRTVKTNDQAMHGTIAWQGYNFNDRISAGSQIAFTFHRYVPQTSDQNTFDGAVSNQCCDLVSDPYEMCVCRVMQRWSEQEGLPCPRDISDFHPDFIRSVAQAGQCAASR